MTKKERLREVILQLKQIKDEREFSCADIQRMVRASGDELSLTTIKRVFGENSEELGFRYNDTIRPIVQALLVKEETPLNETEVDTLKNVVLLKDTMINELTISVKALEEKLNEANTKNEDYRQEIQFLREQLARKDDYIDRLAKKVGI